MYIWLQTKPSSTFCISHHGSDGFLHSKAHAVWRRMPPLKCVNKAYCILHHPAPIPGAKSAYLSRLSTTQTAGNQRICLEIYTKYNHVSYFFLLFYWKKNLCKWIWRWGCRMNAFACRTWGIYATTLVVTLQTLRLLKILPTWLILVSFGILGRIRDLAIGDITHCHFKLTQIFIIVCGNNDKFAFFVFLGEKYSA